MLVTLIVSIITFVLMTLSIIFLPTIKLGRIRLGTYWIVALLGATILLSTSLAPIDKVFEALTAPSSINPLKILVLFFSMSVLSVYLDEVGLFRYLASVATRRAKGSQIGLFLIFYALTSVLTVFTSNDIVILTLTPFICFFAKSALINPLPYLIAEFAAANTWSMMLLIGNPTNIYLATSANIDFLSYFKVMAVPTLFGGIIELAIVFLLFHKDLKAPLQNQSEHYPIQSKPDLILGLALLGTCLLLMAFSSYLPFEMWIISATCALVLLLVALGERLVTHKHWDYLADCLKRLPYALIPFILSMFVIVVSLNVQGVSAKLGDFLNQGPPIWVYGYSSFLASNLINNIPMSILFSSLPASLDVESSTQAIYASIIGSNIGAFLTPIGALAGIMSSSLLHKQGIKFSFLDFSKFGFIVSIPTLSVSLLGLFLVL